MPKGYWIARIDVHDADAYQSYIAAAAPVFAEYGARFLVRNGDFVPVQGDARSRNVVLEFPSYHAALDCYRSNEYQHAKTFRDDVSEGEIVVVEGYDGAQPADAP